MLNTDINQITINIETKLDVCQKLWQEFIYTEQITDLWDVRMSFHRHFNRALFFVVAKNGDNVVGLIPMCYIEEHNYYAYFPGETWDGKTWLEQNRIYSSDDDVLRKMIEWLNNQNYSYYLRYLQVDENPLNEFHREDEIGYYFIPEMYNYSMDVYYSNFRRKRIKTLQKEINYLYEKKLSFRFDELDDFDDLVKLNIESFGSRSYFANNLFVAGFRTLRDYLDQNNLLRITTVLMDNRIVAVDLGALYKKNYTLLAGGTHDHFPGIAKLINFYHIEQSCKNKYNSVDFLCGDFSWKTMFHLKPMPLYKIANCEI